MADKTTRNILEWIVKGDKAALASYDAMIARAQAFQQVVSGQASAVQSAASATNSQTQATSAQTAATQQATTAQADYNAMLKASVQADADAVAQEQKLMALRLRQFEQFNAQQGQSDRLNIHNTTLGRVGSELRQLPSIRLPGANFGTDAIANVLRVGGAVQAVSTGMGDKLLPILLQLGAVAPIVALAVVGLAASVKEFLKTIEAGKQSLGAALNAQQEYYDALKDMTSREVRARIAELQRNQPIVEQQLRETAHALGVAFDESSENFGDLGARLLDVANQSGDPQLRKRLEELNDEYNTNAHTINRLTEGLRQNQFAANDAREALLALAKEGFGGLIGGIQDFIEQANDLTDQIGQHQVEANQALLERLKTEADLRAGTAQEARDYFDTLVQERMNIVQARNELMATGNQSQAVQDQIKAYNEELKNQALLMSDIATNILPQLEIAERLVGAVGDFFGGIGDGAARLQAEAQAALDVVSALDDLNDAYDEHAQKLADIEQKFADAQGEAAYDRERALEDAEYDAGQKRLDAKRQSDDDLLKLEADTERKRQEILRRFNRAYLNAIGERDALAAYQAQQQRDDALADLNETYDAQKETIQARYDEQLRTIDASLQDAQRTIERRYEDQLRTANLAHERALQAEAQRWNAELTLRQSAYQQAQQNLANALAAEAAIQASAYADSLVSAAAFHDGLVGIFTGNIATAAATIATDAVSQILSGYTGGSTGSTTTPTTVTTPTTTGTAGMGAALGYASGGRFGAYQTMQVGENGTETVIFDRSGYVANANTTRQMQASGSGNQNTVNLNMDGKSVRKQSRAEAVAYINQWLTEQGVE